MNYFPRTSTLMKLAGVLELPGFSEGSELTKVIVIKKPFVNDYKVLLSNCNLEDRKEQFDVQPMDWASGLEGALEPFKFESPPEWEKMMQWAAAHRIWVLKSPVWGHWAYSGRIVYMDKYCDLPCTIFGLCHELGHIVDDPWSQDKSIYQSEIDAWKEGEKIYREVYGSVPPAFYKERDEALESHSSNPNK